MAKTEDETLRKLKEYYDLGSEVLARSFGLESKDARKVVRLVAEENNERPGEVSRARQFAELFSGEEFVELCELPRSDGKPMGWGHLIQLLPVRDKKQRWRLLRQSAKENWPVKTLAAAAKAHATNKREKGGGVFKLATTVESARNDIQKRCNEWLRWQDQLEWPYEGQISLDELPLELRECLGRVKRAVQQLKETSASERKRSPKKKK